MEIEKKYRIKKLPENLETYTCLDIEQGYLCIKPVVRIRKMNEEYILTYKSKTPLQESQYHTKISNEVELPLTESSYIHLREKVDGNLIQKKRYLIPLENGLKVELDVFGGHLKGLIFAEVEFHSVEAATGFIPPDWFGEDVSLDKRFNNSYLSQVDEVSNI
ncbi:MAG: CYTH domain-containing protein [Lachnospiraceae bacterium]|nr:CYTH domain-containing protein [Lachnospiraceae bacterium]